MKAILTGAAAVAAFVVSGCTTMNDSMDDGMQTTASASTTTSASSATSKEKVVKVGGAEMYPTKTIVENAMNSPIHTTLVKAVQAAGLVDTLNSAGPFTVFAPTDEAFARVPAASLNMLMMPENKALLTKVLTYHVVPGRITAADIKAKIEAGGGTATYTTVEGQPITFTMTNGSVMLAGMGPNSNAFVTQADVMQSNGVIHVINGVLTPTM